MKYLFLSILFATGSAFAAEVCVIEDQINYGITIQCTISADSVEFWMTGTDMKYHAKTKAELIKTLLEKGYEFKSNGVLIKN